MKLVTNNLLLEFVLKCNNHNITPSEQEIMSFLTVSNKVYLFNEWVRLCFYNWEEMVEEVKEMK
jgi:hypothetical protein